jgi:hypothetical protein
MVGDQQYELFTYEGGIRIPRMGRYGPFIFGARENPVGSQQVTLNPEAHPKLGNGGGIGILRLATIVSGEIHIGDTADATAYDIVRTLPLDPAAVRRDSELGGRIGLRRLAAQ